MEFFWLQSLLLLIPSIKFKIKTTGKLKYKNKIVKLQLSKTVKNNHLNLLSKSVINVNHNPKIKKIQKNHNNYNKLIF